MNVLVTGAKGFVGKNLCATLNNIASGKDKSFGVFDKLSVMEYDTDSEKGSLQEYCVKADFVFNLAGVNRPKETSEFMEGNFGFAEELLDCLKKNNNRCPVMLASSIQASLEGRFKDSDYGKSKLAGEKLFFDYGKETGARVLVYRFTNVFGKWCMPNYNSVVATFCYNIANDLPIQINDKNTELELVYIDDLVAEMIAALKSEECRCEFDGPTAVRKPDGAYCMVPVTHKATLGQIAELLEKYRRQSETLVIPDIAKGSFEKKLYSTYLSYLPKEKVKFPLHVNGDERGSFTELLKTESCGQFSVNISKPGITKGQHWHHSKWEFFIVVAGHALIQERKIDTDEIIEFEVYGNNPEAVHMLPGYTHNIINLSDTENLITLMWANEQLEPEKPDTYYEPV